MRGPRRRQRSRPEFDTVEVTISRSAVIQAHSRDVYRLHVQRLLCGDAVHVSAYVFNQGVETRNFITIKTINGFFRDDFV